MKRAIAALAILTAAAGPALARGRDGRGWHRHGCGAGRAPHFPYGDTVLAAATAFSIIYDSIRGGDGFYPVPVAVPQPVAVPVAVPVRSPLPPYCPPYTPLACRAPAAWPPAPWYTAP